MLAPPSGAERSTRKFSYRRTHKCPDGVIKGANAAPDTATDN